MSEIESDGLSTPAQNRNENPGKSTEGAYQAGSHSWLGGPQNGNETPSPRDPQTDGIQKPTEAAPSNLWDENNLPPNMTKELWAAVATISGAASYQLFYFK